MNNPFLKKPREYYTQAVMRDWEKQAGKTE